MSLFVPFCHDLSPFFAVFGRAPGNAVGGGRPPPLRLRRDKSGMGDVNNARLRTTDNETTNGEAVTALARGERSMSKNS
mgnify:CR=1 FL=1